MIGQIKQFSKQILIKEVPVSDKYKKKGVFKDKTFEGECFIKAGEYVLNNKQLNNLILIHGTINANKERNIIYEHAWVEFTDNGIEVVFDGVDQKFYDKKDYYEKLDAMPDYVHNKKQYMKMFAKTLWLGKWYEPKRPVWDVTKPWEEFVKTYFPELINSEGEICENDIIARFT